MMIRFMKFRTLVAGLLTAAFVGSYLLAGNYMTANACENNMCSEGCHRYVLYGSNTSFCLKVPDGVYWDLLLLHVGASNPGGTWVDIGPEVTREVWENCCVRGGSIPPGFNQETKDYTGVKLGSFMGNQNLCTGSG